MAELSTRPVILDTDIGDDIDDTWALAMLLRCPELDLKLITTGFGDTHYRARLVAKLLAVAGRHDVPIGIGKQTCALHEARRDQAAWVKDFNLSDHPGSVYTDGVEAMIDTIMGSPTPVTLLAIGPLTNVREALRREPRIAERARFVGMCGCLRRHHRVADRIAPEYNIVQDIPAAKVAFTAPWDMTITPLDTCGFVTLDGPAYQRLLESRDPLVTAVFENYRCWEAARKLEVQSHTRSTILFDTVAVYLAYAEEWLQIEELPVFVDDDGFTRIHDNGRSVRCATQWRDLEAFKSMLVDRLLGAAVKA